MSLYRRDMTLESTINQALALTRDLHESLTEGQWEAIAANTASRGDAMAEFRAAHEAADTAERDSCASLLRELAENDRLLQDTAKASLSATGAQMRTSVGASPHYGGTYDQQPDLACVDRKA